MDSTRFSRPKPSGFSIGCSVSSPAGALAFPTTTLGLGSYLVNGPGDCNACHNAGPGNNQFLPGGNPFFGQPKHINPATYLGGGRNFGQLGTPPSGANIISRNLTPDKTGLPSGGDTFEEFRQIMRTGVDFDHLHPTCPGVPDATCVPAPFNGNLLQVMPWPNFQNRSEEHTSELQSLAY